MLVIDYVLYNGEPIIEFRLKYLHKYVDIFIIVESMYTHSGNKKKDLYYNINKNIFKDYDDKILFYQIENLATADDYLNILMNNILYERKKSWVNEVYQRDYIQKILKQKYSEPFIIFVCDVDEIPKKELYMNIKHDYNKLNFGAHIEMLLLNYGFRWKKENCIWRHPFVINDIGSKNVSFSNLRLSPTKINYLNSGWHVTNCFKIDDIIRKFESFSHTEYNVDKYKNKEYLLKCIHEGKNILNEDEQFVRTEEEELPEGYVEFQEKTYNYFL